MYEYISGTKKRNWLRGGTVMRADVLTITDLSNESFTL